MPLGNFQVADQRSVSVSMLINDRRTVLVGQATYHACSEIGPCLMIAVKDSAGDYDLVLGREWAASVVPGGEAGADYQIALGAPEECTGE